MAALLRGHHVLVLPSEAGARPEGLPTVILEALAAGRAVVAGRTGGVAEVVDDSVGACVEPGDVGGLIEALDMLDRDRARLAGCGARGRARADVWSADRGARILLDALDPADPSPSRIRLAD